MTLKEFIISRVQVFFILVTLILTATIVLGTIFDPERELRYYQLISPIIIAAYCVLPTFVSYFKKEPTLRQFVIRKAIELALIEVVVMLIISAPEGMSKLLFYFVLALVVGAIYVLTMLTMWLKKFIQSKKLTEQLKRLQESE